MYRFHISSGHANKKINHHISKTINLSHFFFCVCFNSKMTEITIQKTKIN